MNLQPAVGEDDASTWNSSFVFVPAFFWLVDKLTSKNSKIFIFRYVNICCDLFWMAFNARLIGWTSMLQLCNNY